MNKNINGDCLEVMKDMEENSVDTIITDPPYGMSFMGKKWDYDVPGVEIWQECLRVLKPGGTALIFAGSRTQHRMACNVEDAGFILKDCIMWLYGCLSDDTEVLTQKGFKRMHKTTKYDTILVYDNKTNIYKWETPSRWSTHKVNEHSCYHIESDKTNQIVSKEHTCLIERNGKLVCKQAWELHDMETMPYLSEDFFDEKEVKGELLFKDMLWKGENGTPEKYSRSFLCEHAEEKKIRKTEKIECSNDGRKQSCVEGWHHISKEKGQLCQPENKTRDMSPEICSNGEKRRLCNGTPSYNGNTNKSTINKNRMCSSCESQRRGQQIRKSNVIQNESGTQKIRTQSEYKTTLATVKEIKHTGTLFCPTVSTGLFVARRKGQIFVTGNSGFPKATDISKNIDKTLGVGREIVGFEEPFGRENRKTQGKAKFGVEGWESETKKTITKPATEEAQLWNGWKSHGLKPAYEPILVCMKPNDGTYANNALVHGVSGLNMDGCRIEINDLTPEQIKRKYTGKNSGNNVLALGIKESKMVENSALKGRFPANIILDEEAGAMLDEQSDNASRFFYCAKASKSERNAGCENLKIKYAPKGNYEGRDMDNSKNHLGGMQSSKMTNNHPTVKPLKLMEYLCNLTKTPTGGIVLDPFAGSGTTGVACKNTGRGFILIEMSSEYCKIIKERIKNHVIQGELI